MSVLIETTVGDLVVDLFVKERPKCSLNFLKLCKMKYYNLCQFHYIEKDYVAQTGDPTGTGRGGESIFASVYGNQARFFEKEEVPRLRHVRRGLVSMVDNGLGMLGSQFFITLTGDPLDYLDDKHTIFGQVSEGDETLDVLNAQLCDDNHAPFRDIRISHTIVLWDPLEDLRGMKPPRSPSPTWDRVVLTDKICIDEKEDEDEGKTAAEIEAELQEKETRAQAQILEMVGDLHHADEAPPDNVLFVCKLNPVTTDEDLEIIFSRFGSIIKCEVIRDRRTKQSLQYAFIEFEKPESCERAFFKMDNVLIDDRRIHVDFSQSVAKNYQWDRKKTDYAPPSTSERSTNEERRKREPRREEEDASRKRLRYETRRDERRRERSVDRQRERKRSVDKERERSGDRERGRKRSVDKERERSGDRARKRSVDKEERRHRHSHIHRRDSHR